MKPPDAAIAKPGAWRMRDDQEVPAVVQNLSNVTLDVSVAVVLGRQQVASCVMALFQKRISDCA